MWFDAAVAEFHALQAHERGSGGAKSTPAEAVGSVRQFRTGIRQALSSLNATRLNKSGGREFVTRGGLCRSASER
jgi:hypothetical protein